MQRLGKFGEASLTNADFAFAVSDGMGGALAGEYASNIAVEKITTLLPKSFGQRAAGLDAGFEDVLTELYSQYIVRWPISGAVTRSVRAWRRL